MGRLVKIFNFRYCRIWQEGATSIICRFLSATS